MRILDRITNKRTEGGVHHISINNFIALIADITENKADPLFSTIKWGQVKGNEETIYVQSQTTQQGKGSRRAENKVSRISLRIYYDSHMHLANLGSYYRISS